MRRLVGSVLRSATSRVACGRLVASATPRCLQLHPAPHAPLQKLARVYMMELSKLKSEARMNPDPLHRAKLETVVAATPLTCISGLDAKIIVQILSTLEVLEAAGGSKTVDDCVTWVVDRRGEINAVLLAQVCASLCKLCVPRRIEVLELLSENVVAAIPAMNQSTAMSLLASYAAEAPHVAAVPLLVSKVRHAIADTTSTDLAAVMDSVAGTALDSEMSTLMAELIDTVGPVVAGVASHGELVKLFCGAMSFGRSAALREELLAAVEKDAQELTVPQLAEMLAATKAESSSSPLRRRAAALLVARWPGTSGAKLLLADAAAAVHALAVAHESVDAAMLLAVQSCMQQEPRSESWTPLTTAKLLDGLALLGEPAASTLALLVDKAVPASCGDNVEEVYRSGFWLAARMRPVTMHVRGDVLRAIALYHSGTWSAPELMAAVRAISFVATPDGRKLLRDLAPKIVDKVQSADALLLSSIAAAYGRARVRHENLCNAINERAIALKDHLGAHEISVVLTGLAAMEHRSSKCFLDLLPAVRMQLPRCSAAQVAGLITAYANQSVWNYRLFAQLGDRALVVADRLSIQEIVAIVTAFQKMDVRHLRLMAALALRAKKAATVCTAAEAVGMLSAFSRSEVWDASMFEDLAQKVVACRESLDAAQLGEALLSFARVDFKAHRIFQDLSLRAVALAPTCPPLPLAAIVTAYAAANCQHVELFNVLGERALALKDDCPAVTLSAVLVAFATVGIKNDRLFIEMIPRMRHVAQYGGPQDIANVLVAYTNVGLWHYKLFVRLADRAVQVRGECRGPHIAKILGAFAKVDMKYEKLFTEMSPRVQTVAKHLTPADVAAIGSAYASAKVFDGGVFKELSARAIVAAASFEPCEVDAFLAACRRAGQLSDELVKAFPSWNAAHAAAPPPIGEVHCAASSAVTSAIRECEAMPEAQL